MNKKYIILIALLSVLSFETKAGPKLDVLSALERAPLDFVGDLGEGSSVVTDAAAMGKEVYQKGTEAKALFEKIKLKAQNAIETIKSHIPGYGDENDASYEEQLSQAEDSLANTPNKLKNESKGLDVDMQDRKNALYTQAAGKKQAAEENINVLKAMLGDGADASTEQVFSSVISENEQHVQKYQSEMNRSLSLNHRKWIDKRQNWNGENEVTHAIIYRIKVDKMLSGQRMERSKCSQQTQES